MINMSVTSKDILIKETLISTSFNNTSMKPSIMIQALNTFPIVKETLTFMAAPTVKTNGIWLCGQVLT